MSDQARSRVATLKGHLSRMSSADDLYEAMRQVEDLSDGELAALLATLHTISASGVGDGIMEARRDAVRAVIDLRVSSRTSEQADAIRAAVSALGGVLSDAAAIQGTLSRLASGRTAVKAALIAFAGTVISAVLASLLTVWFTR